MQLRKEARQQLAVGRDIEAAFLSCPDTIETKLESFPKYVRARHLKRFLSMYEIFKLVLAVQGSIVECGVYRGFGLMTWAKLSAILEPENTGRRIYGFDTFEGFPTVCEKDYINTGSAQVGGLRSASADELRSLIAAYDADRWLGH